MQRLAVPAVAAAARADILLVRDHRAGQYCRRVEVSRVAIMVSKAVTLRVEVVASEVLAVMADQ